MSQGCFLGNCPHIFFHVSSTCSWRSNVFLIMYLEAPMALAIWIWLVFWAFDTIVIISTFLYWEFWPCLVDVNVAYASYMLHKACNAFSNPLLKLMCLGRNAFIISYSIILRTMSLFTSSLNFCKVLSKSATNLLVVAPHFFHLGRPCHTLSLLHHVQYH